MTYTDIYDRLYPEPSAARRILWRHSRSVARLALDINRRLGLGLDPQEIEQAAMLHDIGICITDAPAIDCHGTYPYLWHGRLGADLLRRAGMSETIARVAERHTGAGITEADIRSLGLSLPLDRSYMPESLLERLVCYADKFYSKSGAMTRKPLERVRASLSRFGADTLSRFEEMHREFGGESQ